MIKSACIQVEAKSRLESEKLIGEEFNKWMEINRNPQIIHFFEPVREDKLYGDYNYNRYYTSITFFYQIPYTLKEINEERYCRYYENGPS